MVAGSDLDRNPTCLPQGKSSFLEKWMCLCHHHCHYGAIPVIPGDIRIDIKSFGTWIVLFSVGCSPLFSRLIEFPDYFKTNPIFRMVINKPDHPGIYSTPYRSQNEYDSDLKKPTKLWKEFKYFSLNCGEGGGNPFQYSCWENPMDGGGWWPAVHGIAKSQTQLSDWAHTTAVTEKCLVWFNTYFVDNTAKDLFIHPYLAVKLNSYFVLEKATMWCTCHTLEGYTLATRGQSDL